MNSPPRSPADASVSVLHDPSVLIIESHPRFFESLPRTLKSTMPEVDFEVCASPVDGLSKLESGRYHTVISDPHLVEAAEYSLLERSQSLACPVPVLLSEKQGDSQVLTRALARGALDLIRCSSSGTQVSDAIKRALWIYHLRLTIHTRHQRLDNLRLHHQPLSPAVSKSRYLMERTIQSIEEAHLLCERTIQQIEASVRVLEDICRHAESEARECALRVARVL
jgi:DNA-binding NtrC family response regulator